MNNVNLYKRTSWYGVEESTKKGDIDEIERNSEWNK